MEFDKFLDRDIIEFLDEQAMLVAEKAAGLREEEFDMYEITQDYIEELNDALKNGDLRKSQNVFEEVKNRYLKAPPNSLNKKRFYIIMEEIYQRIKDYESKESGKKTLFETIKEYEEKGLFTKPDLFENKEAHSINLIMSSINRKEKELERLTRQKPLKIESLKEAIKNYREMKELTKRIPNTHAKAKSKAYGSALGWYYTLRKLEEKVQGKTDGKEGEQEEKKEIPVEQKLAQVRKIKEDIVNSHNRVVNYINKRDLKKSIEEYRHLKSLCQEFPPEMEEEKIALLADALSLFESIKKLKQEVSEKQQREASEKAKEEKNKAEAKKEIAAKLEIIKGFLEKNDTKSAMKEYQELQVVFNKYPEFPLEEKKKVYNEIISTHREVKALEKSLLKKTASYEEKITKLNKTLEEIYTLLDQGKTEDATHDLLEVKHMTQMLPKEMFDEKYKLLKEIDKLEHKVLFIKNIDKINVPEVVNPDKG